MQLQQQLQPRQVDPPQLPPSLAVLRLQTLWQTTALRIQAMVEHQICWQGRFRGDKQRSEPLSVMCKTKCCLSVRAWATCMELQVSGQCTGARLPQQAQHGFLRV